MSYQCGPCLTMQEDMVPRGTQINTHPGFVAPDQYFDCAACINHHARTYRFPELRTANEQAWQLFFRVQDQQRAGGLDVLGLDYTVLPWLFTLYRVPREAHRLTFEKIALMNREISLYRQHKAEQTASTQRAAQLDARGVKRLDK